MRGRDKKLGVTHLPNCKSEDSTERNTLVVCLPGAGRRAILLGQLLLRTINFGGKLGVKPLDQLVIMCGRVVGELVEAQLLKPTGLAGEKFLCQ